MNIHEYQAKAVLREFGVPVPRGIPAFSVDEAVKAAKELGGPVWVVKAQIHAGGRGKAGGVKVVKSVDDVKREADAHARLDAGDAPDRAARQGSAPPLHRGRLGHRPRISISRRWSIARRRASPSSPRPKAAWTSRRSRARTPEKIITLLGRSGDRLHAASRARASRRRCGSTRELAKQAEAVLPKLYAGVPRQGHEPARDQSAGRHQGRQADLPRRQDRLRRQRALSAIPTSRRCAT